MAYEPRASHGWCAIVIGGLWRNYRWWRRWRTIRILSAPFVIGPIIENFVTSRISRHTKRISQSNYGTAFLRHKKPTPECLVTHGKIQHLTELCRKKTCPNPMNRTRPNDHALCEPGWDGSWSCDKRLCARITKSIIQTIWIWWGGQLVSSVQSNRILCDDETIKSKTIKSSFRNNQLTYSSQFEADLTTAEVD